MKKPDPLFFNKIAAAVLGSALFILLGNTLAESIYASEKPDQDVYVAAVATETAAQPEGAATQAAGEAEVDLAAFFSGGDAKKGKKVLKKCKACHTWDKDGADKVGPNLYGLIGRKIGVIDGFKYSSALKAYGEENSDWSSASLIKFLTKPKAEVKGTSMGFAGLRKEADIANLLTYLNEKASDAPVDLAAQ